MTPCPLQCGSVVLRAVSACEIEYSTDDAVYDAHSCQDNIDDCQRNNDGVNDLHLWWNTTDICVCVCV